MAFALRHPAVVALIIIIFMKTELNCLMGNKQNAGYFTDCALFLQLPVIHNRV